MIACYDSFYKEAFLTPVQFDIMQMLIERIIEEQFSS